MEEAKKAFESILNEIGYQVYYIDFDKKRKILSVYIEKDNESITIDDCLLVSTELNKYLDENEINEEEYILDISSPGIMRPLITMEHYQKQVGNEIEIKLFKKNETLKLKEIDGILQSVSVGHIVINDVEIPFGEITKAKVKFKGEK